MTTVGLAFHGKRVVPVNKEKLGIQAKADKLKLMQYIVPVPPGQNTEEFDRHLSLAQLTFEFVAQQMPIVHKGHCSSASRRYVIYKTKGKEKYFADIFPDLTNPAFTAYMAMVHSRFATNTDTIIENVQPLMIAEFNGEINNLRRFIECVKYDAEFSQLLNVDLSKVDFARYSDSFVMSIYMKMLQLKGFSSEQIHHAIFHPHAPLQDDPIARWHHLMGLPGLEGPNGSIRIFESGDQFKVMVEMDTLGWRPHRGMLDQKRRLLVTGSELGIVPDLDGDLIELGPGDALMVDPLRGACELYQPTQALKEEYTERLTHIVELPQSKTYEHSALAVDSDNLQERKLRAGLTPEIEKSILGPMFNEGNGFAVSMGDDGAPEVTVSGPARAINTIKVIFAQISRPSIDYLREGEVMSGLTFIGARSRLSNLYAAAIQGLYVDNPILDSHQVKFLVEKSQIRSQVIDITYRVCEREGALLSALTRVCAETIAAAKNGVAFIVLSDFNTDAEHASILPMLVAGAVNLALIKAGLRENVTLCMQSAVVSTPLEQVTAMTLGIDVIHPYLVYGLLATQAQLSKEEFIRQCDSYRKVAFKEIMAAAARAGIRSLSGGYRRACQVTALGLDEEVAESIGIYSELGGFDWANIAATAVDAHIRPTNIGKYINEGQESRMGKWNAGFVSLWNDIAYGKKSFDEALPALLQGIDATRKDNLEGWFKLKPPQIWTPENPMTVVIVGGGAAGFDQALALLNSHMSHKIRIKILEENPANLFGLVKDGIAPDKKVTKEAQFKLLGQCLVDPRVEYYGGLKVGSHDGDVTPEELRALYPLVIDCRGAPQDKKLLEMEGSELCVTASKCGKPITAILILVMPSGIGHLVNTADRKSRL